MNSFSVLAVHIAGGFGIAAIDKNRFVPIFLEDI